MRAVLNAGPIISLAGISYFFVLREIFADVLIPKAVSDEILVHGQGKTGARELHQALREAEAIVLALEQRAGFVIMDEIKARKEAMRLGLGVIGTLGILKRAKDLSLVKENLSVLLERLKRSGFRVSAAVEQDFLKHR
ncbi:MAG: DUF3368 domain-containing protein [Candidatus Bipolaricaulota bacterium]|nr:DUF3368 domain-containing protein [Candidatus Bipolaricaulota bacterium]